jgi:CelD/BcsL family acetyltransferase involved in cellulose biosynthesis
LAATSTPIDLSLQPVSDLGAVAARWRALEAEAAGGFFRGWTFVSQQAARFADPHLLAMRDGGRDLGLALLNRRGGRFYLNETGDPALDVVWVEHNGVLLRPGAEAYLAQALAHVCARGTLVLSGVDALHARAAAAAGHLLRRDAHPDPALDLRALPGPYLDALSANARGQIRRAMRLCGPGLRLTRAEDAATAQRWFGDMVALHQCAWRARGKRGAFPGPAIIGFHEGLLAAAVPLGQADLLRIASGDATIGYLYNFRHGGRVYCYQSGFPAFDDARMKPGLVSHALAVEHYRAMDVAVYDFLAGAARYKSTLAPASLSPGPTDGDNALYWLTVYGRGSWRGMAGFAVARTRRWGSQRVGALKAQLALIRGRGYGRRGSPPAGSPHDV